MQDAQGNLEFVEVKNGPTAKLSANQESGYPAVEAGGAVPQGANATAAGLQVGTPLPPMTVEIKQLLK